LPTAARDGLLGPEELVGGLAIREATAEVVSRGCRHSQSRRIQQALAMAAPGYGGPQSIFASIGGLREWAIDCCQSHFPRSTAVDVATKFGTKLAITRLV